MRITDTSIQAKWLLAWLLFTMMVVFSGENGSDEGYNRAAKANTHIGAQQQNMMGTIPVALPVTQEKQRQVSHRFIPKIDSDLSKYTVVEVTATGYSAGKE